MANKSINKFNVAAIHQSGKVGTIRYYQRGGETFVRSAHNAVKNNPRTDAQMRHRLLFASRSVLWQSMKGNLRNAFSGKKGTQSDFNMFMQLNDGLGVYFSKQQMAKGAQVIFPVQITDGKLESILCVKQDGKIKSNIALGSLAINANTSVSDFSAAVVSLNEDFEYGDSLSFIAVLQRVNGEGIPKISSSFLKLELSRDDSRKLWAIMPDYAFLNVGGFLGTDSDIPAGCFAYVHSRNDGQLLLSSQSLISNNAEMIELYGNESQYELARDSYGSVKENFFGGGTKAVSGSVSSPSNDNAGGSSNSSQNDPAPSGDVTITVNVSSAQSEMGMVCIDDNNFAQSDAKTVPVGTQVTIYAERNSGYQFDKWSDGSTEETRVITVNQNMSLTASFYENEE